MPITGKFGDGQNAIEAAHRHAEREAGLCEAGDEIHGNCVLAHIFGLWQTYLDNVNPLLKVTHTPTLQASIVNSINKPSTVDPILEALMFSVYCVALLSLSESECLTSFNSTRSELLARYQIACREALLCCKYLHSRSRDCLTALYLYLVNRRKRHRLHVEQS